MTIGTLPVCFECARLVEWPYCNAFGPDVEIPLIIASAQHDHTTPVAGDHGRLFQQADEADLKRIKEKHP